MEYELVVGTGIGGARQICEAAQKVNVPVRNTRDIAWPRDAYVCDGKRYRTANSTPSGIFGEGGYIRVGKGYLLMGTGIGDLTTPYTMADFLGRNGLKTKMEAHEALLTQAQQAYPDHRIHLVPTSTSSLYGHPHVDMGTLLIPKARVLLVDTHFGKITSTRREVDEIAMKEDLELIRFDGTADRVWYPLNSSVFPLENDEIVFVDSKSKSLIKTLEKRHIWVAPVEDFPQHDHPAGKINCMTNICHRGADIVKLLGRDYAGMELGLHVN